MDDCPSLMVTLNGFFLSYTFDRFFLEVLYAKIVLYAKVVLE
jgi:hypothetical protein